MPDNAYLISPVSSVEIWPPDDVADEEFLAQAEGQIRGYGKLVVSGIIEIGKKLVEVKERVGQTGFEDFVTARLGWSRASGYRFIAVFAMLTQSQIETEDLTIDASSLYRIAAPSTPAEVREQVLVKAATPEGISRGEVEKLVAAAKAEGITKAKAEQLIEDARREERVTLNDEIADLNSQIDALNQQLEDGFGDALQNARNRLKQLEQQRDDLADSLRKANKALKEKPPEPTQTLIDGTVSFRAMCIRQAVSTLREELKITPAAYVAIEREVAERVHSRSADEDLAAISANAKACIAWLNELIDACED